LGHFALKKIGRAAFSNDDARSIQLFTNELEILKSLSHRHIVKLVGSYTDRDCVGLLMWPVADKNLAQFLKEDLGSRDQQARKMKIRTFFGCIAMALDYLHNNETRRVRHKDIKPGNILVKDNKVYVADFGTSHAWTGDAGGMTEGTLQFFTSKYLAPEAFRVSRICDVHSE
jgi:serine/threonine protein kinase